jgi:hypothetical protein
MRWIKTGVPHDRQGLNAKVTGGREGEVSATALRSLIGIMLKEGTLADDRVHRNVRPLKSM